MSDHPKLRSILIGITTVVVFLFSLMPMLHLCDKNSIWLQFPLMLFCLLFFPAWLQRAVRLRQVVMRSLMSIVAVIALQMGYLTWLHSDFFPGWLLFPKPRLHIRTGGDSSVTSSNNAAQRTGASRSADETNGTSGAAGSRR
jgi:hypothetical protein